MMKIFKYPLAITEIQIVELPVGSRILTFQLQNNQLFMWAIVDPSISTYPYKVHIFGTGEEVPDMNKLVYIATVQQDIGVNYVWHIFMEKSH